MLFTCVGCIDVDSSPMIYGELARAQEDLVLTTELHLLYLVTPLDLRDSIEPDWMTYFKQVKTSALLYTGCRILFRKNTAHFLRTHNPREQRTSLLMTCLSNVSEGISTRVSENVGQGIAFNSSNLFSESRVVVKYASADVFLS